jgi:hypothetical protein
MRGRQREVSVIAVQMRSTFSSAQNQRPKNQSSNFSKSSTHVDTPMGVAQALSSGAGTGRRPDFRTRTTRLPHSRNQISALGSDQPVLDAPANAYNESSNASTGTSC